MIHSNRYLVSLTGAYSKAAERQGSPPGFVVRPFLPVLELIALILVPYLLLRFLSDASDFEMLSEQAGFNLYWIPVLIMSARHGLKFGLLTCLVAIVLYLHGQDVDIPALGQSFFEFQYSQFRLPIFWILTAVVIGLIVDQRESLLGNYQEQFDYLLDDASLLKDTLEQSVERTAQLEKQIVSEQFTFNTLLSVLPKLQLVDNHYARLQQLYPAIKRYLETDNLVVLTQLDGVYREVKDQVPPQQSPDTDRRDFAADGATHQLTTQRTVRKQIARIQSGKNAPLYGLLVVESHTSDSADNILNAQQHRLKMVGCSIGYLLDSYAEDKNWLSVPSSEIVAED